MVQGTRRAWITRQERARPRQPSHRASFSRVIRGFYRGDEVRIAVRDDRQASSSFAESAFSAAAATSTPEPDTSRRFQSLVILTSAWPRSSKGYLHSHMKNFHNYFG